MKILITSGVGGVGHVINLIRFGLILKRRGHEITFAHHKFFKNIVESYSIDFIEFDEYSPDRVNSNISANIPKILEKYFFLQPLEAIRSLERDGFLEPWFLAELVPRVVSKSDLALRTVLEKVSNIDLVIVDQSMFKLPVLLEKNLPHVDIFPFNPLLLYPEGIPPWAGYSEDVPRKSYEEYKDVLMNTLAIMIDSIRSLYNFGEAEVLVNNYDLGFHIKPKYLGFYHYPEDLDYDTLKPITKNYERIDSLIIDQINNHGGSFSIPEKLQDGPGRLIYFSLGTIASGCRDLMNNLLKTLSSSPNRFIVTLGAKKMCDYHTDRYENIWCCEFVDQIAILKQVELIIFHGGNNSMMEALFFGVPMIVIPLSLDQIDNAQRVEDKKIGKKMFLWELNEVKLLDMVEDVLMDEEIHRNVTRISSNMRKSKSAERAVDLIEDLFDKLPTPEGNLMISSL